MRVLITSHEFACLRGVPVFAHLVAKELVSRGHEVTIYSPFIGGPIADRTRDAGVALVTHLEPASRNPVDVVLVNGSYANACEARLHVPDRPMVFVYHAAAGMPNRPVVDLGIAARLALSEEIRDAVRKGEPEVRIEVLRSPVDTARFRPATPLSRQPRSALIYSGKFTPTQVGVMRGACEASGVDVRRVLAGETDVFEVEAVMNDVDLVFTRGRGAIEAMACGRVVVIPGDGMVTAANIDEIEITHFSGRRFRFPQTHDWFVSEIAKFDPKVGDENARLAGERYSATRHADRLASIFDKVMREPLAIRLSLADRRRLKTFADAVDVARAQAHSIPDALRRQEMLVNVHGSSHRRLLRHLYNGRLWVDHVVPWSSWVRFNQRLLPVDSTWRRAARSMRNSLWKLLSR
jgi:hypothetical protein